MKTLKRLISFFLFSLIIFALGCDEKTEVNTETCGDSALPSFINMKADFIDWGTANYAHFSLTVEFTNVCIYKNAIVDVHIFEKPGSLLVNAMAFVLIDNSTAPDFHLTIGDNSWDGELSLNLKQGFKSNPGNFRIKVDLFLNALSEEDAKQKYDAYISGINITSQLYRPK